MDSPFKSSFIPKQSVEKVPHIRARTVGFLSLFVVVIFLTSLGLSVGVYLYQGYLKKTIAQMHEELNRVRVALDPARLEELRRLDIRIKEAQKRLDAHTAPTLLFDLLETNTLENVRYKNFEYKVDELMPTKIRIEGEAKNFSAVALQSDAFNGNKNVLSPIFDGLNSKGEGFVDFTVDASVAPDFISYGNSLGFGTSTPLPGARQTGRFDINPPGVTSLFGSGVAGTQTPIGATGTSTPKNTPGGISNQPKPKP